jgi:MarR family 2-MHQ and catechol resistance regulon transcriptional repressor
MDLSRELELERPLLDIRHEALLNILHTANLLHAKGAQLFRRYGLTEAQFNVLFALKYKRSSWTQSDLGKRLVITRASVTSVLDRLERKGYIRRERVDGNRRIRHVVLTQEGKALITKVERIYRRAVHRALRDLSDAQCAALIDKLEKVRNALQGLSLD